jgi:hypothetical protein
VCHRYPEIIDTIKARGDDVLGHGRSNAEVLRDIATYCLALPKV